MIEAVALCAVFFVVGQILYNRTLRSIDNSESKTGAALAMLVGMLLVLLLAVATIGVAALILGGMGQ